MCNKSCKLAASAFIALLGQVLDHVIAGRCKRTIGFPIGRVFKEIFLEGIRLIVWNLTYSYNCRSRNAKDK